MTTLNEALKKQADSLLLDINSEATVLASQVLPENDTNSADQTNKYAKGVLLFLDVTAVSGTSPTLDVKLQAKDPVTNSYVDIPGAAFSQKTGVSTDSLTVYPGVAETANRSVSDVIPLTWRAVATVGGSVTPTATASLGVAYIR